MKIPYLTFLFLFLSLNGLNILKAQDQITLHGQDALQEFNEITENMLNRFPNHELYIEERSVFTMEDLPLYLSQHFERLRLLESIEGQCILKLQTYRDTGIWFRQMHMLKESNSVLRRFLNQYSQCEPSFSEEEKEPFFNFQIFVIGTLADNYAALGVLDSAEVFYKENIVFSGKKRTIFGPSTLNNYGMFLQFQKKDLDKALIYYQKAFTLCKGEFENHSLLGSIRDNMADVYLEKNDLSHALNLYHDNFSFFRVILSEKNNKYDITRLLSAASQAIDVLIELNRPYEAIALYAELIDFFQKEHIQTTKLAPKNRLLFIKTKAVIEHLEKNDHRAYESSLLAQQLADSINLERQQTEALWNEVLTNMSIQKVKEKAFWERTEKENEIAKQRLQFWIVVLLASIIISVSLFLYYRNKLKSKLAVEHKLLAEQRLMLASEKNKRLNLEVASKKRDLSDLALNLGHHYDWTQLIFQKFDQIRNSKNEERNKLLEELEEELNNKIDYDSETKLFFEKVDELSDAFYQELHNRFPDLTKTEQRLCSLIRLKIESRQIATLQNITLQSVNKSRYRIRKKMDLKESQSLDDFIQSL